MDTIIETTEKKLSRTNLLKKRGKRKVSKHLGSKKPKNIEEIKRKAKAAKRNKKK